MYGTPANEVTPTFFETRMEFSFNANIPSNYILETSIRMEFYHRLNETTSCDQVDKLKDELVDRFGPIPIETKWLMALNKIRIFASSHQFHSLKFGKITLLIFSTSTLFFWHF